MNLHKPWTFAATLMLGLALGACSDADLDTTPVTQPPTNWWKQGIPLPHEPQTLGDPERGYQALIQEGYIGCGIPYKAFNTLKHLTPVTVDEILPGRSGPASELPYSWNHHVTPAGVELAVPNCLLCHGGHFNGEMILGLGTVEADYTADFSVVSHVVDVLEPFKDTLFTPGERAELDKFVSRAFLLGDLAKMLTVGLVPANQVGLLLFAHRDPVTLAWSDEPLLDLPPLYAPVALDVPPWWRLRKKSSTYYNGMGRGDHHKMMMIASSLCVDTPEEAREIQSYFTDIAAYLFELEPPEYPFAIDTQLADQGERVFLANCAGCHGTYGPEESYPNLSIPTEIIQTDSIYSIGGTVLSDFIDWVNQSVYAEGTARLEPTQGYVAPPLDAVWATAPFLHNASIPTVAALLDSSIRPQFWKREDYDSRNFDEDAMGWPYIELDYGQDDAPNNERRFVYDTTKVGHGNEGHTFGDHLTPTERRAVIEYLKTL